MRERNKEVRIDTVEERVKFIYLYVYTNEGISEINQPANDTADLQAHFSWWI